METITFKRLAIYLLTFFLVISVIFVVTDIWKVLDYKIVKSFYSGDSEDAQLHKDILVVNFEKPKAHEFESDLEFYRNGVINFLHTVSNRYQQNQERPHAIVLDFSYSSAKTLLPEFKQALDTIDDKIEVYAVYNMLGSEDKSFEAHDAMQASQLYDNYFQGGRLDSGYDLISGVLTYQADVFLQKKIGDTVSIGALVRQVASDFKGTHKPTEGFVLALGPRTAVDEQMSIFSIGSARTVSGNFTPKASLDEKFLLIGDLANDYSESVNIPGTHIVAWALTDQLADKPYSKQPFNNPGAIIGQLLFFSFFTVVVFALLFKYVKRLQTKPILLAVLAFGISMLFLFLYGLLILSLDLVPLIGLTVVGMVLAALLSWRFAYKFLVTGIAEGSQKYDVFVSYSHGDSAWVTKNIYEPLVAFRKPNGDRLNIFFDTDSIGIGEAFTSKYMWAIVDSACFIPIMSPDYYGKNHCKNEMDLAYKRSVEKLLHIIPVVFSYDAVPEIYTHINFADITVNPNFIEEVLAEIVKQTTN